MMKIFQKALFAFIASSAISMVAHASDYTNGAGTPYVGAKVGQAHLSTDGLSTEKPISYGVVAGFEFTPNISAELEYMKSSKADFDYDSMKGEIDTQSYGMYGAYRYFLPNSNFYGKGKIGLVKNEVTAKANTGSFQKSVSSDDTGLATGVGLGFQPNQNLALEAEFSRIDKDINVLSLGANLKF